MSTPQLRIGFISPMHYPAQPPFKGGAEATSYYTTELLARYGHKVYLFQRGNEGPPNVENIQFDAPTMFDQEHLLAGAILRFAESEKIDVLINTSWIDSLPAANLMGYGPPVVQWLTIPYNIFQPFDTNLKRYAGWGISRFKIFAQTSTQATPYEDAGIPVEPLRLPVPLGKYAYTDTVALMPDNRFIWAGRPTYEKAPDRAIDFATRAFSSIYLFASQTTELWESLKEQYKHNGTIQFFEDTSPEHIAAHMYHAKATLFLNRNVNKDGLTWQEPGSRVIMESLLQGCPVIGTKNGCLTEWITHGENGYLLDQDYGEKAIWNIDHYLPVLDRQHIQQRSATVWSEDAHYRRLMDAITQTLGA